MAAQESRPCMVRPPACTRVECAMLVRKMASVHALVCSPSRRQRYLLLDGQQGLHVSGGNVAAGRGRQVQQRQDAAAPRLTGCVHGPPPGRRLGMSL